jgi:hypothetical protein
MKTAPDTLGTAKNEYESAKHEIETQITPYRRKRVCELKT